MINQQHFFDQAAKNNFRKRDNICKIATIKEDNSTTGCLLDYLYFTIYCKMTAIDLKKTST